MQNVIGSRMAAGGLTMGVCGVVIAALLNANCFSQEHDRLPGTESLLASAGELAPQRQQVFNYFEKRIAAASHVRDETWRPDFSSARAYQSSLEGQRKSLRTMLGLTTIAKFGPARIAMVAGKAEGLRVDRVTIPIDAGLAARGLLLTPPGSGKKPAVIVCPDANTWPERLAGLDAARDTQAGQSARVAALLANGSMVYVAQSIERLSDHPYCAKTRGKDRRAILYRLGYVVGRTMPGIDVQDTLAAVAFLSNHREVKTENISVAGRGQGGMTALMAAALDARISAATVTDYFDRRDRCWDEPVDRRLRDQLLHFGDAELAAMIAPRSLTIEASAEFLGRAVGFESETQRASQFFARAGSAKRLTVVKNHAENPARQTMSPLEAEQVAAARNRHFEERLTWLRRQISESQARRYARWNILGRSPDDFPNIQKAMLEDYRQMVGTVPDDGTPMTVRSELALATKGYRAYRVTIDVVKGVSVYGNLLVPFNVQGKRPAVICQHGFGGSPEKITGLGMKKDTVYHEFGRKLAENGYVVFAPMLMHYAPSEQVSKQMRQANAVGMMRVAMPVAKTNRVIDFLESLDYVDADRIGYYGLSYGGYSAIWMTPLIDRLAVSVISGNFNDWRSKITSDELNTSYLRHPDEDMYSWDCLNRFTHPELIAMMIPRPVCVEFGHRDGITTPEWTAYAWAQTKELRDHLRQTDRIILAEFDGAHEIRGDETFTFLDRFLWPDRAR
jgi:cephalosporin-C deacetylase-like acetyl esterase